MSSEIIFEVTEADEGGYCASALGYGITTQAETIADLREMVRDAVGCYFDDSQPAPKLIRLHFVRDEGTREMRIPRDLTGAELVQALRPLGYQVTRQTGSHIRVTTQVHGEHHEVVPNHSPVKIGTLRSILRNVAAHHQMSAKELLKQLRL